MPEYLIRLTVSKDIDEDCLTDAIQDAICGDDDNDLSCEARIQEKCIINGRFEGYKDRKY